MKTIQRFRFLKSFGSFTAIGTRSLSRVHLVFLFAAVLGLSAAGALGSDPVGIYALVDKVVFEPSDSAPERIQVWGAFALAEGGGYKYAAGKRGIMYFKLKPGEEEICRKEWNDIKSVAGTGQIVAFGTRYDPKGSIYSTTAKLEKPDVYPVGFGLTKITKRTKDDYAPIKDLRALPKEREKTKTST